MSTLLAIVERPPDGGALDRSAVEALSFTAGLAAPLGAEVHAAILGAVDAPDRATLGAHGATTVHTVDHPVLESYAPQAWGAAVAQLAGEIAATGVVARGTEVGNEVLAHAAAEDGLPLATNCLEVTPGDGPWSLVRQRWGGMLLEEAVLDGARKLVTIAPHSHKVTEMDAPRDPTVVSFAPLIDEAQAVVRAADRVTRDQGLTLATAPVVVSGGRGVGSAEGFAVLEELAELLGGAVGCSRVATNNGWRPHSDQVGQTGTRVAPDLYIACGISGATQHWVGCMNAKRILAINTDPEAPMMTRAHDAVVGDVHEVLPAVVAELRRRAG